MPALDERCLNIYTDGSSKPRPRRGGIAFRFVIVNKKSGEEEPLDYHLGKYMGATNNQMELLACIEALRETVKNPDLVAYTREKSRVVIYTDSKYIKEYYNLALYTWKSKDWQLSGGSTVSNIKLWEELNRLRLKLHRLCGKTICFEKVKAHKKGKDKDEHNDAVDRLAKQAADCPIKVHSDLLPSIDVGKKLGSGTTELKSVKIVGQTMNVYIVSDQKLKKGLYRYKYEVVDKGDTNIGKIDHIDSSILLNARHYYRITVNENSSNPLVISAKEVKKK